MIEIIGNFNTARVYVGHNSYFGRCKCFRITYRLDLFTGNIFQCRSEALGGVELSYDFYHIFSFLTV